MTQPQQSYTQSFGNGGAAAVGPDATNMLRAAMCRSSIKLWIKTKLIPTRGVGIMALLSIAGEYTGKKYTRNQAQAAVDDLDTWVATMRAALPHLGPDGEQQ
jgi:hypothetical protein